MGLSLVHPVISSLNSSLCWRNSDINHGLHSIKKKFNATNKLLFLSHKLMKRRANRLPKVMHSMSEYDS